MAAPELSALLARVLPPLEADDPVTIASQVAIASIPAPTGAEGHRAAHMLAALGTLTRNASVDHAGNVVATWKGAAGPPVVVCAHLDTVFSADVPHTVSRHDNRLTGPGIGDNARGLAALLAIARFLSAQHVVTTRPIVLAATVGEEGAGDLRGARYLFTTTFPHAHAVIALDGAGDSRIVAQAIGVQRFHLRITGRGGHSWASSTLPNPLHAATNFAARVTALPQRETPRTTIAITRLHGGLAINAIPEVATVDVEVRSDSDRRIASAARSIADLAHASITTENARRGADTDPLGWQLNVVSRRPAGAVDLGADLLQYARDATRAIGRTPELAMASTDANIPMSLGIPAIALGGGGTGGDAHTTREWYANVRGPEGVARVLATLLATAGLA